MSKSSGSPDYDRFDELVREFAERSRRGERPSIQEFIDRLPEIADEIHEMFPALADVEQVEAGLGPSTAPIRSSPSGARSLSS